MKLVLLKISVVTVTCLWILPLFVGSASAHRVNVFAWAEGNKIFVESKFSGGKKVKAAKLQVLDSKGVVLLAGRTNDEGEFSFKVPKTTDLRILIDTGQGHQGEWTIRAAELSDMPLTTTKETSTPNVMQSDKSNSAALKFVDSGTAAPHAVSQPEELEAVIESILDRKLKPIIRMLADMHQKGPTAGDIFAGIGYIFGLVGIAAYVHSRKKKE